MIYYTLKNSIEILNIEKKMDKLDKKIKMSIKPLKNCKKLIRFE